MGGEKVFWMLKTETVKVESEGISKNGLKIGNSKMEGLE